MNHFWSKAIVAFVAILFCYYPLDVPAGCPEGDTGMRLASIEIDLDIHKLIEAERRSFDEPPYKALRRLIGLDQEDMRPNATLKELTNNQPWRDGLVEVPNGSLARMSYDHGRQIYHGQFLGGRLVIEGKSYMSLSSAASALAVKKGGGHPSLNGWRYWQAKFPGETNWRSLWTLRAQARGTLRR